MISKTKIRIFFALIAALVFISSSIVPINTSAEALPPLVNPQIVTGKQVFPAQAIFSDIKKIPGGASGYQLVVETDVQRAKTYVPQANDPYYYKYYTSFWQNGQHALSQVPASLPSNQGVVGYNNPYSYYTKASSSFPTAKWYDSYIPAGTGYYVHHIQNKIVGSSKTWLPNGAGIGTNYYEKGNELNNITLNFRIELGKLVTVPNGQQYYQKVLAGEVTPEGWGIVPMTKDIPSGMGFYQWVFMVPQGADYKVHGASGACPHKTCTFNCMNGQCSVYCWQDQYHAAHLVDPPLPIAEADLVRSMDNTMPMGGGSTADLAANGKMYYIGTDGAVAELPADAAKIYAGWSGQIFVNGSANSLSDAQKNAISVAQMQGRPLVLVYMAQSLNYNDIAANSVVINNLQNLTNNYDQSYGDKKIQVISHSWSGHLVQNVIKNNTNVTHIAINPAKGPFDPNISWTNDLNNSTANTVIMTGYQDLVTAAGMGSGYLDPRHGEGFISGSSTVYNIINSKSNIDSKIIYNASHGVDSMIANGLKNNMPALPAR